MVPDYQSIMLPLLKIAADEKEHRFSHAITELAQQFHLTDDELKQLIPSGQDYLFSNRCGWAKTYLKKAGLVAYPARGRFRITESGLQLLAENPDKIDLQALKKFPEFLEYWNGGVVPGNIVNVVPANPLSGSMVNQLDATETPEEKLESASLQIRKKVTSDLLDKIKDVSPAKFERIVLKLLQKMGYGNTGSALGGPHDGGIDGVIQQDRLGIDRIYFQAKRWSGNSVGAGDVRDFVEALAGMKAKRGVFITSSRFSSDALAFANSVSEYQVVLIDGGSLADLMYEFEMGATRVETYFVKRLDNDFFDDAEEG